ncbi:MAG: hypothetical protein R6X20_10495 [Phycisphaerae bacterium]
MSELPPEQMEEHLPGYEPYVGELGVMDALRMGWNLVVSDFWPIWVLGLVAYAINFGAGLPGAIPYIGACIQLAVMVFVLPPLFAGLFYAVARVIDGQKAEAGQVFEGFRQRYWQSVVAVLLPMGVYIGGVLVIGVLVGLAAAATEGDDELMVILALLIAIPGTIVLMFLLLLFLFTLVAVWDHPASGWEAMKASVQVVREHYLSTLGFAVLTWLIALAAGLLGAIACCVGIFFTVPFSMVWISAAMVYLYRSWTGQPLTQPLAEGPAGEVPPPPGAAGGEDEGGPVPPSDVEMPPT